jgi:gas vesicle protein
MSEHSSTSKIILALMAGASIGVIMGAGAALLLSPSDGRTNRRKLKNTIDSLTENIHEKTDQMIEEIQEEIENFSDTEPEKET